MREPNTSDARASFVTEYFGGDIKKARKHLQQQNAQYTDAFQPMAWTPGPRTPRGIKNAWRNKHFLVMECVVDGVSRLTINRCAIDGHGRFVDGITWDELMQIKRGIGYGDRLAVEIFPEDEHIVNDSHMRHLFLLNERPAFAWTKENRAND